MRPGKRDDPRTSAATDIDEAYAEAEAVLAQAELDDQRLAPSYAETLFPDGAVIEVRFDHAEVAKMWDRFKWFGHFVIAEPGEFLGRPIIRAWNAPIPGRRLGPRHALYNDYIEITGLRPPPIPSGKKPERFLELFLRGVQLQARTRVSNRVMDSATRKWTERPKGAWYSVIDRFTGVSAGCPFVLRRRAKQ